MQYTHNWFSLKKIVQKNNSELWQIYCNLNIDIWFPAEERVPSFATTFRQALKLSNPPTHMGIMSWFHWQSGWNMMMITHCPSSANCEAKVNFDTFFLVYVSRKSHNYRNKYFPPIRGKNLRCIVSHTLLTETLCIHVHVHKQVALKSKTPQLFGLNNPQIGIKCSKHMSHTWIALQIYKSNISFEDVWNIAST